VNWGRHFDEKLLIVIPICFQISDVCGDTYHLLGDGAYPLSVNMMTPYRNPQRSLMKQKFNEKLSATRVRIENAFGLLKGRFNQLRYVKFHTIEKTARFVKACCAMHNICIDLQDFWDGDTASEDNVGGIRNDRGDENLTTSQKRRQGEAKRNEIALSFL
jgi:DDE superfamily endonuclease